MVATCKASAIRDDLQGIRDEIACQLCDDWRLVWSRSVCARALPVSVVPDVLRDRVFVGREDRAAVTPAVS